MLAKAATWVCFAEWFIWNQSMHKWLHSIIFFLGDSFSQPCHNFNGGYLNGHWKSGMDEKIHLIIWWNQFSTAGNTNVLYDNITKMTTSKRLCLTSIGIFPILPIGHRYNVVIRTVANEKGFILLCHSIAIKCDTILDTIWKKKFNNLIIMTMNSRYGRAMGRFIRVPW